MPIDITDFQAGVDNIVLSRSIFTVLAGEAIGSFNGNFLCADGTPDANDYFIYESDTGRLLYDADATGGGKAILFARLDAGLNLTGGDFEVGV